MSGLPAVVAAALWGAAAGALLPRAAYRFSVPPDESWRTECPAGHPVRGWLGPARCAPCAAAGAPPQAPPGAPPGSGTGPSYGPGAPAFAAATLLVCALLAAATGPRPELAVWLLLAPAGVLLAAVDLRVRRLPDLLTLPLAGAALVLLGLAARVPGHTGEWTTALLGTLALGGGYFVLFLLNPEGMGFGDVKLALGAGAVLGWYGWATLALGAVAGLLLGALYGWALVAVERGGRGTAVPYGPFLIAGALLGVLAGACRHGPFPLLAPA
ncbi:prepilin peptidase [Streptomyces cyaneogriseus]|uniref:prepilin peptidase n=1 Tax=Streptomyces cyaneogriseus TaxID=68192 RepID=UPI0005C8C190|nr:A24 family peptidase [Streptomyces cyaneogriseus]